MPATRKPATERQRAKSNASLCMFVGVLVACSGQPFTADVSEAADAAGGSAAGGVAGGRAGAPPEMHAAAPAGAPNNVADVAASGGGGLMDSTVNRQTGMGGALGMAGEPAAGGASGASPKPEPACQKGPGSEYQLQFYAENQAKIEQELHPFFEVLSLTGKSVPLSRLKIRYYYTKEADGPELGSCFWVTGDRCSLVTFAFSDLIPPTPTANRVMEVSFTTSSAAVGLTPLEVRTGLTVNHANLEQSNDYSFLGNGPAPGSAQASSYRPWEHVTLYVDNQLVWGAEPCLSTD